MSRENDISDYNKQKLCVGVAIFLAVIILVGIIFFIYQQWILGAIFIFCSCPLLGVLFDYPNRPSQPSRFVSPAIDQLLRQCGEMQDQDSKPNKKEK